MQTLLNESQRIVSILFGAGEVTACLIDVGVMTHKFLVKHSLAGSFIVRFYPQERAHVVRYEPDLFTQLHGEGIPTPEVVTDSRTGPVSEFSYTIYRKITGVTLEDRLNAISKIAMEAVVVEITDIVERIGRIKVNGFGDLIDAWHGQYDDCQHFVSDVFDIDFDVLYDKGLLSKVWHHGLLSLQQDFFKFTLPTKPSLSWGDLSPQNIILDDNDRLKGIIDLESTVACEPLLTFGFFFARYWQTPLCNALYINAVNPADEQRLHFYCAMRAVRILRFSQQPLPTGRQRIPIDILLPGVTYSLSCLDL